MENTAMNTAEVLFESKGLPLKVKRIFKTIGLLGLIIILLSIIGFVHTLTLPNYKPGGYIDPPTVSGNTSISSYRKSSGITNQERAERLGSFAGICIVGLTLSLSFIIIIIGKKIYLKIYNNHIEGCYGLGTFSQTFNIPIEQIGELSYNKKGFFPSITIRTVHGNNFSIFMNSNEVVEAEKILRQKIV